MGLSLSYFQRHQTTNIGRNFDSLVDAIRAAAPHILQ
jgi:hypothetical protein